MGNEQSQDNEVDIFIKNIETGLVYKYGLSGTICYTSYKPYILYKNNPKYIEYYKILKINMPYTVTYKIGLKNERVIIDIEPIKTRQITGIVKDYLEIIDSNISKNLIDNYYEIILTDYKNTFRRLFLEKNRISSIVIGNKYIFNVMLIEDADRFIIKNFSNDKL